MEKITTMSELKAAIRELEDQDYINEQFLHRRITVMKENLRLANLVKNSIHRLFRGSEIQANLFRLAAGLATSLIVKKFFRKK